MRSFSTTAADETSRFLSAAECDALCARATKFARGGGEVSLGVQSEWSEGVRWARNRVVTAADTRTTMLAVNRNIEGARATVSLNQYDDVALDAAVRRAERLLVFFPASVVGGILDRHREETILSAPVWSDTTYKFTIDSQLAVFETLAQICTRAGVLSAGTLEVSAAGSGSVSNQRRSLYCPSTKVRLSLTVRSPDGTGSGWAGLDHTDWSRIDAAALMDKAIDKCLRSRNPVAVEPGRYTTILEPQASFEFFSAAYGSSGEGGTLLNRLANEQNPDAPYHWKTEPNPEEPMNPVGFAKFGKLVTDPRISVSTDPTDPELAVVPFRDWAGLRPVSIIKNGVLQSLFYDDQYAVEQLHQNHSQMASGSFRISVTGPTVSIDEMIATTQRGILVTRLAMTRGEGLMKDLVLTGYTRDGTWFIQNGKITKPCKNLRFAQHLYGTFAQMEQLGTPVRVYSPSAPAIVPAMKVRDFNFTRLSDAV